MTGEWRHFVFLADVQLAHCTERGTARHKRGLGFYQLGAEYQRATTNNLERDDAKNLASDILGAKCEFAGKVFLGPWAKWDDAVPAKGKADVEDFIDVKGIPHGDLRLIVPANKLKRATAYLSVVCAEPWFWIKGWRWGNEMTRVVDELKKGKRRPAYVVEDGELHDPVELIAIALERRK